MRKPRTQSVRREISGVLSAAYPRGSRAPYRLEQGVPTNTLGAHGAFCVPFIGVPVKVLDMKYTGRNYVWGGLEGRCISHPNHCAAWRSSCPSPRRSHGVPTEARDFHGSLCPKMGMSVAKISDCDPPAWVAPERRSNGSELSEVRQSPRSVAIQQDSIFGNRYSCENNGLSLEKRLFSKTSRY